MVGTHDCYLGPRSYTCGSVCSLNHGCTARRLENIEVGYPIVVDSVREFDRATDGYLHQTAEF